MTVEEKVGQVIQGDVTTVTPDDVRKYHLGSVLNGGGSGPDGDDFAPARVWLALADAYYEASIDKSGGRAGIPVHVGHRCRPRQHATSSAPRCSRITSGSARRAIRS